MNAPLVDVGEKFPLYDEYIANSGDQQTTEDQRASAQIALIGSFALMMATSTCYRHSGLEWENMRTIKNSSLLSIEDQPP